MGLIPGLGKPPGGGHGHPLQYSCLENSMDRGAWWAAVHGAQRVEHNLVTNTHTFHSIYPSVFMLLLLSRFSRVRLCATP